MQDEERVLVHLAPSSGSPGRCPFPSRPLEDGEWVGYLWRAYSGASSIARDMAMNRPQVRPVRESFDQAVGRLLRARVEQKLPLKVSDPILLTQIARIIAHDSA